MKTVTLPAQSLPSIPDPPVAADAEAQPSEDWHLMDPDAVVTALQTSDAGLTHHAAHLNLNRYGPNILAAAARRSALRILLAQFNSLPVALLGVAAAVSIFTGGLADALVIAGVVLANAVIGYLTESQSDRIIHSLRSHQSPIAVVIRENQPHEVKVEAVVPGDVLLLKPGQYVAADARLLAADNLSVDESALTGESLPVSKTVQALVGEEIPLADRSNMVYKGTLVTGGQGLAVVIATGSFTEMGQIQTLVDQAEATETPLSKQLDQVGSHLVLICSGVCALVFGIGLLRGYGLLEMLKVSISLAVAAVPEGLPTIATTTLALGIQDMRQRNVLVRGLSAVEALGSVQTICLDKTGTLTENKMSVVELYTDRRRLQVQQGQFWPLDAPSTPLPASDSDALLKLLQVALLCNESTVEPRSSGEWCIHGSPTETALMELAIAAGMDVPALRARLPRTEISLRSEQCNLMRTVHRRGDEQFVAVKGSPEEVLALCQSQWVQGQMQMLTPSDRQALLQENERMASKALRVLGLACAWSDADTSPEAVPGLTWLGLVGMADPIRSGVRGLIRQFHQAGIRTVMITGDQRPTAAAIGEALHLNPMGSVEILDSNGFSSLAPAALQALCDRVNVFARVSPANKLQIVRALQSAGQIVAMTGDGINDAPALKSADVGVAMGHAGTDVAREVADLILEDDRLETMIVAVGQGRTIYRNIRKAVHFLLATNLSEIMVTLVAIAATLGQPLNAIQLLWLNLVSDVFPGLALALEPPEPGTLSQPPRSANATIIQSADFQRILFEAASISLCTLAAYGWGIACYGIGATASTIAFLSLTCGQLLNAISSRSETHSLCDRGKHRLPPNPYLIAALGLSFGLIFLAGAIPWLRHLLQLKPVAIWDAVVIVVSAVLPLAVNELTKRQPTP